MGKHSRRKGKITSKSSVDDKKAHKERQKERRQRTIEALDQNGTDGDSNDKDDGGEAKLDAIIDVGDRVRYSLSINQTEWKWGVVSAILDHGGDTREDNPIKSFSVLPWQAGEDLGQTCHVD
jgi:hypothetical protein